jgi:tetratricopeptide (TPR) repeat protein
MLSAFSALILSSFLGWLSTPLQGDIRAYAFPLMGNIPLAIGLTNPFKIISFGVIIFAIGILGIVFLMLRAYPRILFYLGGLAAIVCLSFILNLVFLNPEISESLLDQNRQAMEISLFSRKYLSGNAQALMPYKNPATETLLNKVVEGVHYMGYGWYAALICALIVLPISYRKYSDKAKNLDVVLLILSMLAITTVLAAKPLKGEFYRRHGDIYLASGEINKAIDYYDSAISTDFRLQYSNSFLHNVGAALYQAKRYHRQETHLFTGDNYMSQKEFLKAFHEYEIAFTQKPELILAKRKMVDALIIMGLDNYAKGKIYTALVNWEQAVKLDHLQIAPHLFLTKALLDIHTQEQSLAIIEANAVLKKTKDKLVKADIYNLLGDIYYKQKEFVIAREMYSLSKNQYSLVKRILNFDAMKGLQGI